MSLRTAPKWIALALALGCATTTVSDRQIADPSEKLARPDRILVHDFAATASELSGDSALAADECQRIGQPLPPLAPDTAARLRELLPEAATVGNPLDYTALIWGEVETRIKTYLVTKFLVSALTGFLTGLTLAILGVDLALLFGVMAFLLNFIPSVGSIVAVLLPLPVVLVSPEMGLTTGILAFAIPGAIQFTLGNVIEPFEHVKEI